MKKAIMFNGVQKIDTAGRAKILVNEEELKLEDITAVRYDLRYGYIGVNEETGESYYNDAMLDTIAHNRRELPKSLHIVQLNVMSTDMEAVVEYVRQRCGKVAVFAYVTYGSETWMDQVIALKTAYQRGLIDRLMIREPHHAELDAITIKTVLSMVCKALEVSKPDRIGFCDSPVGCSLGYSCLPAALCRNLSATYGDDIDMVLPSQNHEGMLEDTTRACNCIGHVLVRNVAPCPIKVSKSATSEPKEKREKSSDEQKKPKVKPLGKKIIEKW